MLARLFQVPFTGLEPHLCFILQAIKSTLQALAVVALFSSAYAGEWLPLLKEHTVILEPLALDCLCETGTTTVHISILLQAHFLCLLAMSCLCKNSAGQLKNWKISYALSGAL